MVRAVWVQDFFGVGFAVKRGELTVHLLGKISGGKL